MVLIFRQHKTPVNHDPRKPTQIELHDEDVEGVEDAHAERLGGPKLLCGRAREQDAVLVKGTTSAAGGMQSRAA